MEFTAQFIESLQEELLRVTARGVKFQSTAGEIEGATETDVISHLTSGRTFVAGRKYRFPNIGNGWNFSSAIEAAGFQIVRAKNRRGQSCNVVTIEDAK